MKRKICFSAVILFFSLFIMGTSCNNNTTPDKEYIKIGLLLPKTGDLRADEQYMGNAARLAASEINDAGGLFVKEIKLIFKDTGTDSAKAAIAATKVISENNVIAIIGGDASSEALAIAPIAISNNIVQIAPGATSPEYTNLDDNNYCWRTPPSDAFQGKALVNYLKTKYTTAGIIYVDNSYGKGLKNAFKNEFECCSREVLTEIAFPENPGAGYSYKDLIDSVLSPNPDVVFLIAYYKSGASIINTLIIEGHTTNNWYGSDGLKNNDFITESGNSANGLRGVAPLISGKSANFFRTNFINKYGEQTFDALWGGYTYDAMALLGLAMKKAGQPTPNAVKNALNEISNPPGDTIYAGEWEKAFNILDNGGEINYQGASGDIDFDENGDVTDTRFEIWKIQNGEFVHVEDIKSYH